MLFAGLLFLLLMLCSRSILLDPEGKVIEAIWNEDTKHPQVKYYYSSAQECMAHIILSFLHSFKGTKNLKKFSLKYFKLAICNPFLSFPSLTIVVPLWFIFISLVIIYLN